MKTKLLLALPEASYRSELAYIFEADGYEIKQASTIREVVRFAESQAVDLILSDMRYSDGTGLVLIEKVREMTSAPIIVVTDISEDLSKVLALEYGADDLLVKPFNILELKARMRSVLRRAHTPIDQEKRWVVQVGDLTLRIIGRQVQYKETLIDFTGKEFDILLTLASEPGEIISRLKLAETVWNEDYVGDIRTVDVHIKRIRKKFKDAGITKPPVQTKWGEGYYLQ